VIYGLQLNISCKVIEKNLNLEELTTLQALLLLKIM